MNAGAVAPKSFVLVHGTSHGGWCWKRVARRLREQGHDVHTPTLTGLGERSHLLNASINLDTHIQDIVNVMRWEELSGVCLVGHSSGGVIVSGVAEQEPGRIASIVFLDAFLPENGQKGTDWNSQHAKAAVAAAIAKGEISRPPVKCEIYNVNEKDRAWVDRLTTPQPIGTALQPIRLTGARDRVAKKTYIRATGYPHKIFDANLARCRADPSWRTFEVPCGHDVMVDMPDRLAEILEQVA